VEDYKRHGKGNILNSFGPYTLVADAASPDAEVARKFRKLVDQYTASPSEDGSKEIVYWLTLWKNNHTALQETIKQSPILKDIEPIAQNIHALSQTGLQALEYISTKKIPSATWIESNKKLLEEAKKPQAKCELRIVESIEKLVNQAGKIS
jgi:hexosaminidase